MYIDSHAHIEADAFDADREQAVERALASGVEIIVNIGNGDLASDSHSKALRVAEKYPFIYTTVGAHPHEARLWDDQLAARLAHLSEHPKVIAWGETGLDYHYDNSPREAQQSAFRKQLRMARERHLPAVIHTRDAEEDTLSILNQEWRGSGLPGIVHCFTGTRPFAEAAIELGFLISFSGVLTFKNAEDLRATAVALPPDSILIETDSPFLAPVPYRGRRNEPVYVIETARCLAGLRGITIEEAGRITSENFRRLFRLDS